MEVNGENHLIPFSEFPLTLVICDNKPWLQSCSFLSLFLDPRTHMSSDAKKKAG